MFPTFKSLTKAEAEAKAKSMPDHRTYSTCEEPCRVVFATANAMKEQPRKAIIAACVAKGVCPNTASKQYNDWKKGSGTSAHPNVTAPNVQDDEADATPKAEVTAVPIEPLYSVDNILEDGCFIAREKLEKILERLKTKKNLILQGPPGTGKTWLAKRLAFALVEQRDDSKVRAVQFHPNLSYEDFIRGWRPVGDGKLTLVEGPFMEMIEVAKKDRASRHVVVIEEINRGHPAQIFGEMLTLLEDEYWFDALEKSQEASKRLLEEF